MRNQGGNGKRLLCHQSSTSVLSSSLTSNLHIYEHSRRQMHVHFPWVTSDDDGRERRKKRNEKERTEEKEVKEHSQGYQNKYTIRNETQKNDEEEKVNKEREEITKDIRSSDEPGLILSHFPLSPLSYFSRISLPSFSSLTFSMSREGKERKKEREFSCS